MVGHLVTEDDERLLSGEQIKSVSAPQHTPGPWEWNDNGRLFHNVPASHSSNVLVVHDPVWRPMPADARLIAAAPELYEALVALRGYGCPVCNGDCASANPTVVGCPMQQASAALAKARGEVA